MHHTLAIVVPALNEENCIRSIAEALTAAFSETGPYVICFVDDGSVDHTWDEIESIKRANSCIFGIKLSRNFGKDAAILAGISSVSANAYIVIDADGQHPPSVAREMLAVWLNGGYEVVNAKKRGRSHDSFAQKALSTSFNRVFRFASGMELSDASDFKLISHKAAQSLLNCNDSHFFFRAMVGWIGFPQTTVYFDVGSRVAGKRSWSTWRLARFAVNMLIQHSSRPFTFFLAIGAFCLIGSMALLAKLVYQYFLSSVPPGYPTVVALLLISLSVNMLTVGVLGLYVKRIFDQSNNRPRFLIESITS